MSELLTFRDELDHFRVHANERFRSEAEAAAFLGGPAGYQALLSIDEFGRALRISGYTRPPEHLFEQISQEGVASIRELLQACEFPRELQLGNPKRPRGDVAPWDVTPPRREVGIKPIDDITPFLLSPDRPVVSTWANIDLQEVWSEIARLRDSVNGLGQKFENTATSEALSQERNARETEDAALRQMGAKIEESLARETVVLRADNADFRASLTDTLRLLSEERKERRDDSTEVGRQVKELQLLTEERVQKLETLSKSLQTQLGDSRSQLQEADQLREMSEFRMLSAVAEESRGRESSILREQQAREASTSELEVRWRALVAEERQARGKELDVLASRLHRSEETWRADREVHLQRMLDTANRIEDVAREVREETNFRKTDFSQVGASLEDLRATLQAEVAERQSQDENVARLTANQEAASQGYVDKLDSDLQRMMQSMLALREAVQTESAAREEADGRLQSIVDDEARERLEGLNQEVLRREVALNHVDQHWRTQFQNERVLREEVEHKLEAGLVAEQRDLGVQKAKLATQGRELSQALTDVQDSIGREASARRSEATSLQQLVGEFRITLGAETLCRERMEGRLQDQVTAVDGALREEARLRDARCKIDLLEGAEAEATSHREVCAMREAIAKLDQKVDEAHRQGESALEREAASRRDTDSSQLAKLQELLMEERQNRTDALQALDRRTGIEEQGLVVERQDREDRERVFAARFAEFDESLSEVRHRLRNCLHNDEMLVGFREQLQSERADRQGEETRLELLVKEQQLVLGQLNQAWDQCEQHLERRISDTADRLESEAQNRCDATADTLKAFAIERDDRAAAVLAERRKVEDAIEKVQETFTLKVLEERSEREDRVAALEAKLLPLRESCDEARTLRVQHYNEVFLELAKLAEMVSEESKSRQHHDQALSGEIGLLRGQIVEEPAARKTDVGSLRDEFRDVLVRFERERGERVAKHREQKHTMEALREEFLSDSAKRDGASEHLRQFLDREILAREEMLSGATRAWQRAHAKINEDWRTALMSESMIREEGHVRLEQNLVEVRGQLQEACAVADQREDETKQRHRISVEVLAVEESARKAGEVSIRSSVDEVRQFVAVEEAERREHEQQVFGRFTAFEASYRQETVSREEGDRRNEKDILGCRAELNDTRARSEMLELKLEQRVAAESAIREETQLREIKAREESSAALLSTWQTGLREEQILREDGRRELLHRVNQVQTDTNQEREERLKSNWDLAQTLTRIQSRQKEEDENRIEQGERLGAAVENLQELFRTTSPQREEASRRCMEAVSEVRSMLGKEVVARTAKSEATEEAVRDLRAALGDETQQREASLRALAEMLQAERQQREEALLRERRVTQEEVLQMQQVARKTREDEDRRLQERVLELAASICEERDSRQADCQKERQYIMEMRDDLVREHKLLQREFSKTSEQVANLSEADVRRGKESESRIVGLKDRLEECRRSVSGESSKREAELQILEQRSLELQSLISTEVKERREVIADIRQALELEAVSRKEGLMAEARARQEGDAHVSEAAKALAQEERRVSEMAIAHAMRDLAAAKTHLNEETHHREDERSRQQLALQQLRSEVADLLGERRVDVVSMREGVLQLTGELRQAQQARREDVDRLDGTVDGVSKRIDEATRAAREQAFLFEQMLQSFQCEFRQEVDERTGVLVKLDARINEAHRLAEGAVAGEPGVREDGFDLDVHVVRQRLSEEMRNMKESFGGVTSQFAALSVNVEKDRLANANRVRDLTKDIATLQGAITAEEQARQQSAAQVERSIDLVREEALVEAKDRRASGAAVLEDMSLLQRGLQQRDERVETMVQQLHTESNDLRQRHTREVRLREAAVEQLERQVSSAKNVWESAQQKQPHTSVGAWSESDNHSERLQSVEEDAQRSRHTLLAIQTDSHALQKEVKLINDRLESLRDGLGGLQGEQVESQMRVRAVAELEVSVAGLRDELRKELEGRRSETQRACSKAGDADQRLERIEELQIQVESTMRQEILDAKAALKKEARDQEMQEGRFGALIREESRLRQEALEREGRLRQEGQERQAEALGAALREERKAREREDLRLEGLRSLGSTSRSLGLQSKEEGGRETACVAADVRQTRQAVGDLADRLTATEQRQRSAEERTVSMLDAIMSGLVGPIQMAQ